MSDKAIIYTRVSTIKQKEKGDSLESQEGACRKYCESNNLKIEKVFSEAFTGKSSNRPQFRRAIDFAIEKGIRYFIVFDIDRFSREGYRAYSELKEELEDNGIILKDSKNIIGEESIIYENDIFDASTYKWNRENNSEYSEVILSTAAKIEGKKILQRTIPAEMELEQKGYQVREANYGYKNKRVSVHGTDKKRVIQIKDEIEGDWVIEMFQKRAMGCFTDLEIVNELRLKGCVKRECRGISKPIDVKYMQEIIKKPIYAGIIITQWTGNKPIKAAYPGLIDIKVWNKANKGKREIRENSDGSIEMIYRNKDTEDTAPIIHRRRDYNPDFPFSKVLKCPYCGGTLTGNNARSSNGSHHKYYQCTGKQKQKHKSYCIRQDIVNPSIEKIFQTINIHETILAGYKEIASKVFQEREQEFLNKKTQYTQHISNLKYKQKDILSSISSIIKLEHILEATNKELEDIKYQISSLEKMLDSYSEDVSKDNFLNYSLELIKHLDKLVLQREKPLIISLIFDIVFGGRVEYEKIDYQTAFSYLLSCKQSQQKNSSEEEFSRNTIWQAH